MNRQEVYDKFDGHCAYCGESISIKKFQVDHIVSKARHAFIIANDGYEFGLNDIGNLNPACRKCNNYKSTMNIEEFRAELSKQVKRLLDLSPQFNRALRYGQIEITGNPVVFYFEGKG